MKRGTPVKRGGGKRRRERRFARNAAWAEQSPASVRLDIRPGQPIKDGEEILGKLTKVKVVKNKVAPPFRRAEFDIMFGEGISHSGEIVDLGADLGIIKKSGSWYSYNDTKLGQGRDAAKQCIADNPELAEELEGLIFEELKKK